MQIQTFTTGPFETNCYLVSDPVSKKCFLIDAPPDCAKQVISHVEALHMSMKFVVLTHGHWDHVADAAKISGHFDIPVFIHPDDYDIFLEPVKYFPGLDIHYDFPDRIEFINESFILELGSSEFRVAHVPGHTKGHIALYNEKEMLLFPGDVLFAGSIGRTDLYGGSFDQLMDSIVSKLMVLPEKTIVFPGHGPTTTIARETVKNIFLRKV